MEVLTVTWLIIKYHGPKIRIKHRKSICLLPLYQNYSTIFFHRIYIVQKKREHCSETCCYLQIMKDMERWAKIQNRQKESVRAPSPVLKAGMDDDKRQSKSADAGFAIFERKVRPTGMIWTSGWTCMKYPCLTTIPVFHQISGGDDLFKKPLAPPKKDEKSKVWIHLCSLC